MAAKIVQKCTLKFVYVFQNRPILILNREKLIILTRTKVKSTNVLCCIYNYNEKTEAGKYLNKLKFITT